MKSKTKSTHTPIPIPQIAGYGATADGSIWSLTSNWRGYGQRVLKAVPNGRGYLKVRLQLGSHRRNLAIHSLVAAVFLPPKPSPVYEVRHLDGNPLNNKADNLAWGTRKDNALDRVKHGRTYRPDWSDPIKREKWSIAIRAGRRKQMLKAAISKAVGEDK